MDPMTLQLGQLRLEEEARIEVKQFKMTTGVLITFPEHADKWRKLRD